MFSSPIAPLRLRSLRLVAVGLLLVVLCSCQARVSVETRVNKDGSGTLAVGLGLDDKALAHMGDPNTVVKLDDLPPAGWTVTKAHKEADGLTWIRVSKPFANVAELDTIMAELTGRDAMFRGFTFEKTEDDTSVTYHLKGTLDPTKGLEPASDPALTAALGEPFGGYVKDIEAKEGKPVADMVTFDVTASVGDGGQAVQTYHPTLKDTQVTPVDVSTIEAKPPPSVFGLGIVALALVGGFLVLAMLVAARQRFRNR